MKNVCFWSTVALVAVVLCLETAKGQMYKVNEAGSRQVDAKYCGDQIPIRYAELCSGVRKRRSALMDEQEALSFLHYRSRRNTGSSGATDIVEECCDEGCASEEVLEYC